MDMTRKLVQTTKFLCFIFIFVEEAQKKYIIFYFSIIKIVAFICMWTWTDNDYIYPMDVQI